MTDRNTRAARGANGVFNASDPVHEPVDRLPVRVFREEDVRPLWECAHADGGRTTCR
jgi:hypothetical protein